MSGWNDDQALIEASRAGDADAFGSLVRRYQDRLYPTVLRIARSPEDALDVLQEAFFKAYRQLGQFHGESSFYTWVYRIAINLALSGRRRRGLRGRLRPLDSAEAAFDPPDESPATDPAAPLEQAERDRCVRKALDSLAPDHRAVIILKDMDGLRYEEIAAVLGVPIGTVRSRLHRARGELRDKLSGVVEEGPVRHLTHDRT